MATTLSASLLAKQLQICNMLGELSSHKVSQEFLEMQKWLADIELRLAALERQARPRGEKSDTVRGDDAAD
jgi:hypothetical protein